MVVPYSSGELVALRANTGEVLWTDNLSRGGPTTALGEITDINGHPVVDRGTVYAVGHSGRMVANNLVDGARLWTQDISSSGSPWIAGDFLYLVTSGSELIALSREDGRIRWVTGLHIVLLCIYRFLDRDSTHQCMHFHNIQDHPKSHSLHQSQVEYN